MATIDEQVKQLEAAYAKATIPDEYYKVYSSALDAANQSGLSPNDRAKLMLPGLWAEYYQLRTAEEKDDSGRFSEQIETWIGLITKDRELLVNYYYLLAVVLSELGGNTPQSERTNERARLLLGSNIGLMLKAINARGLVERQKKNLQKAIEIFAEAQWGQNVGASENRQSFANILSNLGLCRLELSDEKSSNIEKRNLISTAIVDLLQAQIFYMTIDPPPLKHIDGLENRFIMAAIRLLLAENSSEEKNIALKIQDVFAAKRREEAKLIIINVALVSRSSLLKSIQSGFIAADEFLAQHKAV